ncbi:O-antigen ligase family protein [Enterococcus hirae]|nr:O-antigen ligase family protein [Enterococcus hirae]
MIITTIKTKYNLPYYIWLILIVTSILGAYIKLGSIPLYKIILFVHLFLFFYSSDRVYSFKNFLLNNRNYLWLFLWFFCSFTSIFYEQINLIDSLKYLYFTFEGLNFIIFSSFYLKKIGTKDIFIIIIILFIISLIIGCIESITGWHLPNSGSLYYQTSTSNNQPTGFLFNTNNYAVYITSYFPIIFYCINQSNLFFNKFVSFFITSITIFVVIETYSRGSMLALLFTLIYIYIIYLKKYTPFLLVLVFGGLLLASISNKLENNMLINKVIKSFTEKSESTNQRIDIYMNTLSIFKSHIIRGVGIGNLEKELSYMETGYFSKSINMDLVSKPHNFFLEQMASLGLMSSSFIIFIFNIITKSIQSLKKYKNKQKLMLLCWLPFISFFIGCLTMSSSIDQRFNWILLGIISYFSDGG